MLSIPCGALHRARANEIWLSLRYNGDDLREDDIERQQDDYGRVIN